MAGLGGGVLLASAARTTTTASATQYNSGTNGVMCWLNISAISGGSPGGTGTGLRIRLYGVSPSQTLTLTLGGDDGNYIRKTGTFGWLWYPGATFINANDLGTGGEGTTVYARSLVIPEFWYVDVQPQDSTSYTYSLEFSYVAVGA